MYADIEETGSLLNKISTSLNSVAVAGTNFNDTEMHAYNITANNIRTYSSNNMTGLTNQFSKL